MAEPTEPKKETVRIAVAPPQAGKSTGAQDTVRITLPTRPPASVPLPPPNPPGAGAPRPPVAKPLIPPAPSKPIQPPRFVPPPAPTTGESSAPATSAAAAPLPVASPRLSPKKETARITVLPDPQSPSGVQMKKTQPLSDMPSTAAPVTPVMVTEEPAAVADVMPGMLCWGVLGASAVILIIQILNYIS